MSIPDSPLGDGGPLGLRPNHPDFAGLVEIILGYDAKMDTAPNQKAKDRVFSDLLAEVIDASSLTYMAMQRAMRMCGVRTRMDLMAASFEVTKLASAYMEGFVVGAQFERRYRD